MAELKIVSEDPFLESSCTQDLDEMFHRMTLKLNLFRKNLNQMMNLMRSDRNPFLRRDALSQLLQDMPEPSIDFETSWEFQNTNASLNPTDSDVKTSSPVAFVHSMVPIPATGLTGTPKWTPLNVPVSNPAKAVETSTKMNSNAKDFSSKGGPPTYRQASVAPTDMSLNAKNSSLKGKPRTYRQVMVPIPVSVLLETPDGFSPMPKKGLKLISASRSTSAPNIKSMKTRYFIWI